MEQEGRPTTVHAASRRREHHSRRPRSGAAQGRSAPRPAPRPAERLPRLDHLAILVVEDHADSRELVRQMLTALGARPLLAGDGLEGLRVLRRERIDVVLCDLLMPELDGFAFIHDVRANPRWASIPIVAVTALGDDADYRRTWEAGFDGHLTKPIEQAQLAAVIRAVVFPSRRRPEA